MNLSDFEVNYLVELDSSPAGRFMISDDDSQRDRELRTKLIDKGLASLSECGEYVEITEGGRDVAAQYQ